MPEPEPNAEGACAAPPISACLSGGLEGGTVDKALGLEAKPTDHRADGVKETSEVPSTAVPMETTEVTPSLSSLVQTCTEDQLLSAFSTLVGSLPADARGRLIVSIRGIMARVVDEDMDGDTAGRALWRRLLGPPQADLTAARAKRPVRAMAMPFVVAVPGPKRLKATTEDAGTAATEDVGHGEGGEHAQPDSTACPGETENSVASPTGAPKAFVCNLPYAATDVRVRNFFQSKLGDERLVDVHLLQNPAGKSKGAAVLTLGSQKALEKVMALDGSAFDDRVLTVRDHGAPRPKGKGKGKVKPESEADARSVIVKNLGFNAGEANLGELFAGCGEVSAVRIAKDRRTGRSKGFAVVEFCHRSAVPQALRRSGREIRGRAVRIEALAQTAEASPAVPVEDARPAPEAAAPAAVAPVDAAPAPASPTPGDRFADAIDDLDAVNRGEAQGEAGAGAAGSAGVGKAPPAREPGASAAALRAHAQALVSKARTAAAGGDLTGEEGLQAAVSLVATHDSAEALLAAVGPEALKKRLDALGLKCGGTPLQRAQRLLQLKGVTSMEDVPKELLAKRLGGPIKFVKATEDGGMGEKAGDTAQAQEQKPTAPSKEAAD